MIAAYASARGLRRRRIIDVPYLTPRLSSYWLDLVTPVDRRVSHALVESLVTEVIVRDAARTDAAFGIEPLGLADALTGARWTIKPAALDRRAAQPRERATRRRVHRARRGADPRRHRGEPRRGSRPYRRELHVVRPPARVASPRPARSTRRRAMEPAATAGDRTGRDRRLVARRRAEIPRSSCCAASTGFPEKAGSATRSPSTS